MGLGPAELTFTTLEAQKVPQAIFPRWAVLGRSNVGKSSFLNALTHPKSYFRTGRTPGVTTGLIAVKVRLGASEKSCLELVDLPGFGFARQARGIQKNWAALAEALKERSQQNGLMWVWLADPTRDPAQEEWDLLDWLGSETFMFIFTKSDRVKRGQRANSLKAWRAFIDAASEGPYWVSSSKGEGIDFIQKSAKSFVRMVTE